MSPRAQLHRLGPALLAAAATLVLAGCSDSATTTSGAGSPAEEPADGSSAAAPDSTDTDATAPVDENVDVCGALPVDELNEVISVFSGPMITEATPQDGGCLLTTPDAQYLITLTSQSVEEVVAGRPTMDASAGATAVTVDGDRTWIQDCGAQTCVAQVIGGPDLVNVVDLIALMNPVSDALTR